MSRQSSRSHLIDDWSVLYRYGYWGGWLRFGWTKCRATEAAGNLESEGTLKCGLIDSYL
jgi:hypothetical protein